MKIQQRRKALFAQLERDQQEIYQNKYLNSSNEYTNNYSSDDSLQIENFSSTDEVSNIKQSSKGVMVHSSKATQIMGNRQLSTEPDQTVYQGSSSNTKMNTQAQRDGSKTPYTTILTPFDLTNQRNRDNQTPSDQSLGAPSRVELDIMIRQVNPNIQNLRKLNQDNLYGAKAEKIPKSTTQSRKSSPFTPLKYNNTV